MGYNNGTEYIKFVANEKRTADIGYQHLPSPMSELSCFPSSGKGQFDGTFSGIETGGSDAIHVSGGRTHEIKGGNVDLMIKTAKEQKTQCIVCDGDSDSAGDEQIERQKERKKVNSVEASEVEMQDIDRGEKDQVVAGKVVKFEVLGLIQQDSVINDPVFQQM